MDLLLSTTSDGRCSVVRVSGEIDLESAAQLGDHALTVIRDVGPRIVLDLGRVGFMDSTGLKVLLSIHRRAELAGGELSLAATPRPVMRVISITGLEATFDLHDRVEDAVAAQSARAAAPDV
jgi:anti-sigma B factor antagonist